MVQTIGIIDAQSLHTKRAFTQFLQRLSDLIIIKGDHRALFAALSATIEQQKNQVPLAPRRLAPRRLAPRLPDTPAPSLPATLAPTSAEINNLPVRLPANGGAARLLFDHLISPRKPDDREDRPIHSTLLFEIYQAKRQNIEREVKSQPIALPEVIDTWAMSQLRKESRLSLCHVKTLKAFISTGKQCLSLQAGDLLLFTPELFRRYFLSLLSSLSNPLSKCHRRFHSKRQSIQNALSERRLKLEAKANTLATQEQWVMDTFRRKLKIPPQHCPEESGQHGTCRKRGNTLQASGCRKKTFRAYF